MNDMRHSDHLHALWRAVESGEMQLLEEYLSDDYRRHYDERVLSREEFASALSDLCAAFPDLRTTIHDVLSDGDRAASRWTVVGTHQGAYLGVPPTGRSIKVGGITISRFGADGRIVEDWASWNSVGVLHTLGIIPIG
jgi:steroid delta-isomerase-like uncharacterized protein